MSRTATLLSLCAAVACAPVSAAGLAGTHGGIDRVVVHKEQRIMHLMSGTARVRTYPIQLGSSPVGQKEREGDGRTPEGTYTIIARNDQSRYFRSLQVSYPGTLDVARARKLGVSPGGLIMIHGQHADLARRSVLMFDGPDWTDGCIAVANGHMQEVWDMVGIGTTVEIYP